MTSGSIGAGARTDAVWPVIETRQSTLIALVVASCGIAPRAVPLLVVALGSLTFVEAVRVGLAARILQEMTHSWPVRAGGALIVWTLISALWATDRGFALRSVGQVGIVVLAGSVTLFALGVQLDRLLLIRRRRFMRAVVLGFGASITFIGLEFATHNAISFAVVARLPTLMGDNAKDFV